MPIAAAGAALAGSFLGAGSTILGNILNNRAIDKQNQANKELAQYSYNQQKQMIAEQNAYNSPAAQMQRYQEAGLNPNLIYSQGTSGNQSQVASYNAPQIQSRRYDFSSLPDVVDTIYNLRLKKIDMDQRMADVAYARERAEGALLDNQYKKWLYGVDLGSIKYLPDSAPAVSRYNAETSGVQALVGLRQGQQILNSLSAAQQQYIINNILPYQAMGAQLNNALLQKQVNTFNWKFGTDLSTKALGSILLGLKLFL